MLRCAILTTLIHLVQVRHTHGAKNETDNEPLKRSGRVFSILFVFQALTWTWCAYHHWWWAWFSPLSSVDMNKCPPALLSTSLVLQKTFILVRYTSSLPAVSVWTHMRTGACYRWVYLKIATELLHFPLHGIPQGAHSILSLFFPFFFPLLLHVSGAVSVSLRPLRTRVTLTFKPSRGCGSWISWAWFNWELHWATLGWCRLFTFHITFHFSHHLKKKNQFWLNGY